MASGSAMPRIVASGYAHTCAVSIPSGPSQSSNCFSPVTPSGRIGLEQARFEQSLDGEQALQVADYSEQMQKLADPPG